MKKLNCQNLNSSFIKFKFLYTNSSERMGLHPPTHTGFET